MSAAQPGKAPVLAARNLCVKLGRAPVLQSVSFEARPGELAGLIGPNGAGKSTLLRALAGLLDADTGSVRFGQTELSRVPTRERARNISFMPQREATHPFTALETVLMGRYPHLGRFELEGINDRRIAREEMRRTRTDGFENRQMDTLSGGEKQRVMLARTIVQQAKVMLLDEPTASLDLKYRLEMMELLRSETARSNVAVVAALHDLSLAARYCDRLTLMSRGAIAAEGSPAEALTPENLRTAFGVEAIIEPDPVTGRPQVSLLGPSDAQSGANGQKDVRVHLICGAGSGRDLMRQLVSAGYAVTAGVLGLGDTDRETAEILGVPFVPAPPFSPIQDAQHERHLALVRSADIAALCSMAVGPNNLRNLKAAHSAKQLVIIEGPPFQELDYTDGAATALRSKLAERWPVEQGSQLLRRLARELTPEP